MQRLTTFIRTRFFLAFATVGLAIVVCILAAFQGRVTAASQQAQTPLHEQSSGWEYVAGVSDGKLNIVVNYDKLTRGGIEAFAAANQQLVEQVHGPVQVSVVFNRPLSIDEFKDEVTKSGIKINSYTMRAVEKNGNRVTLSGGPLPRAKSVALQDIGQQLPAALARFPDATFRGVVTVEATADQSQLKQLLADGRVFTTDVTQAIATDRARAKLVSANASVAQLPVESRIAAPLYWFMENTGIAPR